MRILVFFLGHWFSSLFFQTVFHHRYASHRMFSMSRIWERIFRIGAFVAQGPSYLDPRAYAVMHRMHHAYSDTPRDPHSPHYFRTAVAMMWRTKKVYNALLTRKLKPGDNFERNIPEWDALDRLAGRWMVRIGWGVLYVLFYLAFASARWMFLLLPAHFLMGPIHGAIVNWCGHKYGYQNFPETHDNSRNTLVFDFLTLGELFQNNHHRFPSRPNFAVRRFEVDPVYPIIRLLALLRIIRLPRQPARVNAAHVVGDAGLGPIVGAAGTA